ncbi:hypothetical protein U0070_022717 [Myodes glareolus]
MTTLEELLSVSPCDPRAPPWDVSSSSVQQASHCPVALHGAASAYAGDEDQVFWRSKMGRKDSSTTKLPVDQYRKQIGKQDYKKTKPILRATKLKAEAKKTAIGIKEVGLMLAALLALLLAFYAFFYLRLSTNIDSDLDPDED